MEALKTNLSRRLAAVLVVVLQILVLIPCKTQNADASCRHPYVQDVVTKPATCVSTGLKNQVCSSCKAVLKENVVIQATGVHDYSKQLSTTAATCTAAGYKTMQCANCTAKKNVTSTAALGHNYVSNHVEPTCSTTGKDEVKCSRCGDSHGDTIPATNAHVYSVKQSEVKATCTTAG